MCGTAAIAKAKQIEIIFLGFEAIVKKPYPLAHLIKQVGECKDGAPGFIGNLCPHK
jgi:hypothetical protein